MPALVVAESAAKFRTMRRCLGQRRLVPASFGHLRKLTAAGRTGLVVLATDRLGRAGWNLLSRRACAGGAALAEPAIDS